MHNTVGNKHIGSNDACAVHEDLSVVDGDSQVLAVDGLEHSAVLEARAVAHGAGDDVVGQDVLDLLRGQVGETTADGLEGGVGGRENGDVRGGVDGADEARRVESTAEGGEACGGEGVGCDERDSEDVVNDVDDTAGEVDVLGIVNVYLGAGGKRILTPVVTVELS
jgi:hypothetical protein